MITGYKPIPRSYNTSRPCSQGSRFRQPSGYYEQKRDTRYLSRSERRRAGVFRGIQYHIS